jgi:hypothetical protein
MPSSSLKLNAARPGPGCVPNPLLRKPRNSPCLCGSGKKWKKCCLPLMPLHIKAEDEEQHLAWLENRAPREAAP